MLSLSDASQRENSSTINKYDQNITWKARNRRRKTFPTTDNSLFFSAVFFFFFGNPNKAKEYVGVKLR